ncbi:MULTISPECIES: hypothetical protein [Nitrospirillum]|uniref:Uncharacterized protein n=1 Tax=Nitrospirillum viridazoti CBAmc TaxID=1441467 RepID=A0A248K4E4_9PROT|nr:MULTISPECIES: hypothetical protein [Nitrospirillum]ASG25318.1 hypothetical protein Y958_30745 [Nitrospirillum amazonense CBAmc]MEA1673321.1 hypothetical protein [Nitrospirillum sp. BR 11163]TWB35402.1 hypothetical protein FBZ91_110124 [Nitrospirillum amazonense]
MTDRSYPPLPPMAPDAERLTGLVFELASQLHIERTRRLALETVLARVGVIAPGQADALAEDAAVLARSRAELEVSMRKLMRILSESDDPKAPLRGEVPAPR